MSTAVAGAGIAGLFTAWYLTEQGEKVTLFDKSLPAHGCTWAAAGMLAPAQEIEFQEPEIAAAGQAGVKLYKEMESEWGPVGLDYSGTLEVALDADDAAYLRRLYEFQLSKGMNVEWLTGRSMLEMEPFLSHKIPAAIFAPDDIQIDQRHFADILVQLLKGKGAVFHFPDEVIHYEADGSGVKVIAASGSYTFDRLVLATGTGIIEKKESAVKVFPVRGEMIAFEPPAHEFLKRNVRIRSKALGYGYLVPKPGRILAGSTMEEQGMDARNTAGGMLDILRRAYAAVPGIYELKVMETWAGLRPATLNRLPVIDETNDKGVFVVNGLFRHGIMLGPFIGKAAANFVLNGRRDVLAEKFRM